MSIQGKPGLEKNPAVEQFRNGDPISQVLAADAAPAQDEPVSTREQEILLRAMKQRISKTMRVSQLHDIQLRDYAAQQTRNKGEKVSESDVLEEALSEFFKKRKFNQ